MGARKKVAKEPKSKCAVRRPAIKAEAAAKPKEGKGKR